MLVPMAEARILGRRAVVEPMLRELQELGMVEIADARHAGTVEPLAGQDGRSGRRGNLRRILAQVDRLSSDLLTGSVAAANRAYWFGDPLDVTTLNTELAGLVARVDDLVRDANALRDEALVLRGYLPPLRMLLPLVPTVAELNAERLARLRLATMALVLNTDDERIVDILREELAEELGPRFELVSTRVEHGATGCLVVFESTKREAVRALLDRAAVRDVALPDRFEGLSLQEAVDAMQQRLDETSKLADDAEDERRTLLLPYRERLAAVRAAVATELERLEALERVGATERTFVAVCWVPRDRVRQLRDELAARLGSAVVIEDAPVSRSDTRAPVLMHNTRPVRPFESLVRFLELPRPGSVDPSLLMALVLPLMFGAMVGDVAYGVALLALAVLGRHKFAARLARTPELAGLVQVLHVGAVWSIVFGVVFGEFLGDLGKRFFGDWALWEYRPSAGALEPLLVIAVLVGVAHVVLGLGLGAWEAIRFREYRELAGKLGMLAALGGIVGIAGWVAGRLPAGALVPSAAALVAGLAVVMSLHGLLGLATGPLDLLGRIGNILSYLRLAAVGLASAHLAGVANELGSVGPLWLGILLAAFFHVLNLALASFSPMIQALRLQYVEFFGAFFTGGGRAFKPFGRARTGHLIHQP